MNTTTKTNAVSTDTVIAAATALVTGASSGIGATYAERLAARGHNLVLVARDGGRLESLAAKLRAAHGVGVDIIVADLTDKASLAVVESRLRADSRIGLLVNNAGAALEGGFEHGDIDAQDRLIQLNVTAVTRLTGSVIARFLAQGGGAIVNIASVVGLAPELPLGMYGATKADVLAYSQALQMELGARGLYVQAVLPAATRTEIWQRSGRDVDSLSGVMPVEALVDAALAGFDRRELVTIPPLHDLALWQTFDAARQAMVPNFVQAAPAARYLS